jgi:hypothetical protein
MNSNATLDNFVVSAPTLDIPGTNRGIYVADGVTLTVNTLTIDGVVIAPGSRVANTLSRFAGTGIVNVLS